MAVDGLHATRPVEFPVGRPEEAQGMFDVLTYQKGGGVLRMLEQFLGPDASARASDDYLDHPPLRQHRDRGPVGRHRAVQRAGRARHHGHLDPPGRLPAGDGWADDGIPRPRPRSPTAGSRASAIGSTWQVPVLARSLADAEVDRPPSCWPGPAAVRRSGGHRGRAPTWSSRGLGVLPGRLPDRHRRTPGRPARRPRPAGALQPARDTWAAALSGQAPLADFLRLAEALGRLGRGRPDVWSVVIGALGLLRPGGPRRRPTGPGRGRSATLLGPAGPRPGLGPAPRTTTSAPRRCVPRSLAHARAPSATIPRSGPRPPGASPPSRRAALAPRHRVGHPGHRGRLRAARRVRGLPRPLPAPGHPPGGEPLPLRPGLFADPSWPSGPSSWP